jgi:hypothetical protein
MNLAADLIQSLADLVSGLIQSLADLISGLIQSLADLVVGFGENMLGFPPGVDGNMAGHGVAFTAAAFDGPTSGQLVGPPKRRSVRRDQPICSHHQDDQEKKPFHRSSIPQ